MTTVSITLQDWRAWHPGRAPHADSRLSVDPQPRGASVPAMLRRRLNASGRVVCDMLSEMDPEANRILIYASRHGDGDRTLDMLYALAEQEPLSPARFGMSVHNATLGVHSIASGNRRSLQAIAARGTEVAALFSEVRGYFAEGERDVIVVFSDAPVPERFAAHVAEPTELAVIALHLSASGGREIHTWPCDASHAQHVRSPQPSDVIAWLLDDAPLVCPARRLAWTLSP